jgi:Type IV secretion system pilin
VRARMLTRSAVIALIALVLTVVAHGSADAAVLAAPASLNTVIDNIRNWLVGMLVALATLLLTIGGVRYLLAGGDPGEVQRAKNTLKYAAVGYGVAALSPLLVSILQHIVGA